MSTRSLTATGPINNNVVISFVSEKDLQVYKYIKLYLLLTLLVHSVQFYGRWELLKKQ